MKMMKTITLILSGVNDDDDEKAEDDENAASDESDEKEGGRGHARLHAEDET